MPLANDPDPAPNPAIFWAVLRDYLRHAFTMFGAPTDIARQLWLTRDEHKLMCAWLRVLEQMLRRLVFLDALALAPALVAAPTESKFRRRLAMSANSGANFNLEHSETWRASFDLLANADRRLPAGKRGASPQEAGGPHSINAVSSAPLALRLEALVRGFNNREQLAARCARLIARKRARAWAFLANVCACDRAKPGFDQVALLVAFVRDAFASAFIAPACDTS